jgi:RNAse (barnase) inhibitor barstar
MIDTKSFGKLRLSKLLEKRDIKRVWFFEYLDKTWFGETYLFSHTLRLYTNPFITKSLAIAPEDLSVSEREKISSLLGIDLSILANKETCDSLFGEPVSIEEFLDDRKTFNYFTKDKAFEIGFTILNNGGLVYFTMETMDVAYNKPKETTQNQQAALDCSLSPLIGGEMSSKTYVIDGNDFTTLEEFSAVFSKTLLEDYRWYGNLDAFNDILRGDFGTPDEGFTLIWKNASKSRQDLGYAETARWYKKHLKTCHPSNIPRMREGLKLAKKSSGKTVFDWLVEIIQDHGPGGSESEDGVILRLE